MWLPGLRTFTLAMTARLRRWPDRGAEHEPPGHPLKAGFQGVAKTIRLAPICRCLLFVERRCCETLLPFPFEWQRIIATTVLAPRCINRTRWRPGFLSKDLPVCRRFVRSSILKAQSDRRDLENSVLCPGKRSTKRFSIHKHLTPIYLKKV
jgi:hypothetical protein